jgi:hypothetical protein
VLIVSGGTESDTATVTAAGKKGSELREILHGIGNAEMPPAAMGRLDEHLVVSLGDVDGYPHGGARG